MTPSEYTVTDNISFVSSIYMLSTFLASYLCVHNKFYVLVFLLILIIVTNPAANVPLILLKTLILSLRCVYHFEQSHGYGMSRDCEYFFDNEVL